MTHHPKQARIDTTTPRYPHFFDIPADVSVSILCLLDVGQLCEHCAVSQQYRDLSISALKLTKIVEVNFSMSYAQKLLDLLIKHCTKLSHITLRKTSDDAARDNLLTRQLLSQNPKAKMYLFWMEDDILRTLSELNMQVEEVRALQFKDTLTPFAPSVKHCVITSLDSAKWNNLKKCLKLTSLSVSRLDNITLPELARCPSLRCLALLWGCGYEQVCRLPHLPGITEFFCISTRHVRHVVRSLPNLRILSIGIRIKEQDLHNLGSLKKLKGLNIKIEGGLDVLLANCTQLEVLHLRGTARFDLLYAFEQLEVENVKPYSWEWLHIDQLAPKTNGDREVVKNKLGVIAPKLSVLKVKGTYLKGYGHLPKLSVSPWGLRHFWFR